MEGKKRVVRRKRMIHIHDPKFHKRGTHFTGIVLYTNSVLPVRNPDKKYFLNVTKLFFGPNRSKNPILSKGGRKQN